MKAPAYDPASLPPLPPKKTQADKEAEYDKYNRPNTAYKRQLNPTKSSPTVPQLPSRPDARKPSLPSRPQGLLQPEQSGTVPSSTPPPGKRAIVPPPAKKSVLAMGFGNPVTPVEDPSPASATDGVQMNGNHTPPPIPTTSKPDLAALKASKPKLDGIHTLPNSTSFASCLLCRDYSAPDNHAAKFPRETLPSQDVTQLAQNLTAPFSSATDKARAIFTWLHHNVAYDVDAFFNNCVKPSTPQSTLQSGLAVCEGYAGLFTALAVKAGLESYVITGHGKGYGIVELPAGAPIPPFNGNHAWNAVKIDGGHWKLIDSCWGAGVIGNPGEPYKKRFAPERFTQSNDDFGRDHFPSASGQQLRNDGRTVSWEEYITGNKNGCGAYFFDGYITSEGLDRTTFRPEAGKIDLATAGARTGGSVRFSFQKICPHWDPVRCGKGPYYVYILHLEGLESDSAGKQRNNIPFETNGDVWWCDVPVRDLGSPGQKARIMAVTSMDGRDGRGVGVAGYKGMKGRVGMGYGFVCQWEVV
ncbi:hypothetical protein BDY17DRAFT_307781 [Neohortaea acidophila]|uniref:Transglutaminase-like domain-containing protein n=1 Tax=Neohortaea acidophila TaxID=245834 RepID=A0A6A6Q2L5_9PEZI|nr:uncharacterized protein BDY17DRAFT_307781 [Neohortaea acidophila]KAF2486261.1 hypothetical protein BDY17DRAFT_307781 [Neohortaea acidophila]